MKGIPIDDFIADLRKDPELAKAIDEGAAELAKKRKEMGDEAYFNWILGSFVRVEKVAQ